MRRLLPGLLLISFCANAHAGAVAAPTGVILSSRTAGVLTESAFYDELSAFDIVYVGEKHDEPLHHRIQAAVLSGLHARRPGLVVGIEMLDVTQQERLDGYLDGTIPEAEFEKFWNKSWGYSFAIYRPVLAFAKANGVPVRALNAPIGVVRQVARGGLASLTPEQRALIPADIHPMEDARYIEWVKKSFEGHGPKSSKMVKRMMEDAPYLVWVKEIVEGQGSMPPERMKRMMEAQTVWNETMADSLLAAAREADGPVLVIAGTGHMIFDAGIAESVRHRAALAQRVVLPYPQSGEQIPLADLLRELRSPGSPERRQGDYFWLLPGPPPNS